MREYPLAEPIGIGIIGLIVFLNSFADIILDAVSSEVGMSVVPNVPPVVDRADMELSSISGADNLRCKEGFVNTDVDISASSSLSYNFSFLRLFDPW